MSDELNHIETQSAPYIYSQFAEDLRHAKVYEIQVPKDLAFSIERSQEFLEHLLATHDGRIVLQIVADAQKIVWQVIDCRNLFEEPSYTVKAIKSLYPEAEVLVTNYQHPQFTRPFTRDVIPLKLERDCHFPIKPITNFRDSDPVSAFVNSMAHLREGERYIFTIYAGGYTEERELRRARRKIERDSAVEFVIEMVLMLFEVIIGGILGTRGGGSSSSGSGSKGTGRTKKGKYVQEEQEIFEWKLYDQRLYDCYIILQKDVMGESITPFQNTVNELMLLFSHLSFFNQFVPHLDENTESGILLVDSPDKDQRTSAMGIIGSWADGRDDTWRKVRGILCTDELLSLWHLPHEGFTASNIAWLGGGRAPKELIEKTEGLLIGDNIIAGRKTPIFIHPKDRETHINIIGRPGVGKSTLMHNMIHQDIADGKGVAVVDPQGKLIRDILRASIPDERIDDVIVLDIANEDYPPPLNPLLGAQGSESYTASEVVAILDKAEDMKLPPRTTDTLTAALVTLRHNETLTVRDVVRLFEDAEYRYQTLHQVLHKVSDVTVHEFWEKFRNQSAGMQENLTYPVVHRIRKFYRNPLLHLMMCHPDRLDFAELIKQRKIILVSLGINKGKVPEIEQRLVGTVIVSQLQMAGMNSFDNPFPFYLYIDEVQDFVTTPLHVVLEGARKYNFHLIVANQYLGQLRGKTLDAIMGTVGATIVFQVGDTDASTLARYFRPAFKPEDLMNHDFFNAAVRMRSQGKVLSAFSIVTRPASGDVWSNESIERETLIRRRSIELYTPKTKEEVLEWLNNRYPPPTFPRIPDQPPADPDELNWVDSSDKPD